MSYLESIGVDAGADLSACQYKGIAVGGTIAASGATAMGILQNKPESGEDAQLGWFGRSRFYAGAAVAAGAEITCTTSGWFITAASGTNPVGKALEAVSSGGIGEAIVCFAGNGSRG